MDIKEQIGPLSAVCGLLTHLIFIRGEWHMLAPRIALLYILSPFLVLAFNFYIFGGVLSAFTQSAISLLCFNLALWGSIFVYRVFFHSLCKFPGPFWAKVTKWWQVRECATAQNHLLIHRLHQRYGPIVRTGPNEVTVCDPAVIPAINGSNTCIKAPVYDLSYPLKGINLCRDFGTHHNRRRIWDPAFTGKAMEYYAERITFFGNQLDEQISQRLGEPLLANDWFPWFAFDVIGDLALSKSFEMLHNAKWQHAIKVMKEGMALFGTLTPVPWFCRIGASLPGAQDEGLPKLLEWIRQRMDERLKASVDGRDISSYLIEGSKVAEGGKIDMNWLYGDGFAIIAAGSETVGDTLIFAFYELARKPVHQTKIFEELKRLSGFSASVNEAVTDHKELRNLEYLNGFINEVLRIHPAVPTSGYRVVGPEGVRIGDQIIPPGALVSGPRYSLGRMESCFENAEQIIPERWFSKPEMVRDKRAFSPFSVGKMNCIGQQLAMIEMRYVITLLVGKYLVGFGPGEDGSKVEKDLKDCFSAVPGELHLVFERRQ